MNLLSSSTERLRSVFHMDTKLDSEQQLLDELLRLRREAVRSLWEIGFKACRGDDEKMETVDAVRKEIIEDQDWPHKTRLVIDHFDYIMNLPLRMTPKGVKITPAAAMRFAANCTRRKGLNHEQERALAYLEASKYMWTEGMTLPMKAYRYPSRTRELVAERPKDVIRIIELAREHPDVTRGVELEALLSGQSIGVLVSGEL